jgi:hypothetical protein
VHEFLSTGAQIQYPCTGAWICGYRCPSIWTQVHKYLCTGEWISGHRCTNIWAQVHKYLGTGARISGYRCTNIWAQVHKYLSTGARISGYRCTSVWSQANFYLHLNEYMSVGVCEYLETGARILGHSLWIYILGSRIDVRMDQSRNQMNEGYRVSLLLQGCVQYSMYVAHTIH